MTQEKVIRKWMWVWDFEKEERWLNTMAQSGWVLTKVGFCTYHFAPYTNITEFSSNPSFSLICL